MKHILYIAPHAYPIKSSESICNSKVAYTLAKAGYKVDVFTIADKSSYPADKQVDDLLRDSDNLRIISVVSKHHMSYRLYGWFKAFYNVLYNLLIWLKTGYFYKGISVPYDIVKSVKKEIKTYGNMPYDVMITRGFSTDYVGVYMARKYGIKWIANWNDPYPISRFPKPYGNGEKAKLSYFERRLYDDMQKYISVYTYPNSRLRDYMLKCFTFSKKEQTLVIPHMAHSIIPISNIKKHDKKLRLVHCGDVSKPRNPKLFFEALSNIANKHSQFIECYFIGKYDSDLPTFVANNPYLCRIVHFMAPMQYKESIEFISSCDINLIIEVQCEEGIYLPTKFVDSIQCKVPVFCVSPSVGVLNDLVKRYPVGYCSDNTSLVDIEEKLLSMIDDFSKDSLPRISKDIVPEFFEDAILSQYKTII